MPQPSARDVARSAYEQLKARLATAGQQTQSFLQKYPSPASYIQPRVAPTVKQILQTIPSVGRQAPQTYAEQNFPVNIGQIVGRILQRIPQAPDIVGPTIRDTPLFGPIQQAPSVVTGALRSYGRMSEALSTPQGRQELFTSAQRVAKKPLQLQTLQEPAFEAALNIPDFLHGGLLFAGGVKAISRKGAKELAEKGARELIESFDLNKTRSFIDRLINKTNLLEFAKKSTGSRNEFAYIQDIPKEIANKYQAPLKTVVSAERIIHLKKRPELFNEIISLLPEAIRKPDVDAINPRRPNSFFVIKRGSQQYGVILEVDKVGEYNFLRTVHPLTNNQIDNLLKQSGRTATPPSVPISEPGSRVGASKKLSDLQTTSTPSIPQDVKDFNNFLNGRIPDAVQPSRMAKLPTVEASLVDKTAGIEGGARGVPPLPLTVKAEQRLSTEKYAFNINKERLAISPEQKQVVDKVVTSIKPALEKVKGKVLSNDEVVKSAQWSTPLRQVVNREQTQQVLGRLTKLRQEVSAGAQGKGISADFVENLRVLSSWAADTGRRLQSFAIQAEPSIAGIKEEIVQHLLKLGKSTDEIVNAAQGVDFGNLKEATAFYRQFVKPAVPELIDEYRYINLLSSPQTHIVNAFSNLLQASVVAPGTKLFSGAIDLVASTLTGKERTQYVREVPAYIRGSVSSVGEAFSKFADAMKGNVLLERPDVARIPTGNKLLRPLQVIPRLLEASDVFFRTLIKSGELEALAYRAGRQGKDIARDVLEAQASKRAAYYVFRQPLDPSNATGQGKLLSGIDQLTTSVYALRKAPLVKWFIPFIQTPMNILKQGIEYSPFGIATIPGAGDKTEQFAKILMGSTVFAGAASLMLHTDSTWAAPTGETQKEAFYSSGRQPYSIKIGDQWVSYSRLGPLSYPIAIAAVIKYYTQQDPKAFDASREKKISKAIAGIAKFFSDQSYVQGLGDLVKTLQGDVSAQKELLTSIPSQMVPLSSLTAWVARILDPIYRKTNTVEASLKSRIPIVSKQVEPYTDILGEPSRRDQPIINALSPLRISREKGQFEEAYQQTIQKPQREAAKRDAIKLFLQGKDDKVKELVQKNKFRLESKDIKNYQTSQLKRAADLFIEERDSEAKQILQDARVQLTDTEIKKAAKRKAVELFKLGLDDEVKKIVRRYRVVLTTKDLE